MIDVYSVTGTFADKHRLARDLAAAVMHWEKVPELALFKKNTATFVHDLPADLLSNVDGDSNYVRVQILTPVGVLDRDKQLAAATLWGACSISLSANDPPIQAPKPSRS
jgi:hypothetical protein